MASSAADSAPPAAAQHRQQTVVCEVPGQKYMKKCIYSIYYQTFASACRERGLKKHLTLSAAARLQSPRGVILSVTNRKTSTPGG